ncbi:MAG: endonuclease III [Clostridiales Family XIII bacterium]|nr:endonuclease III [Clostridiales Family XIII bacterium]
MKRDILTKLKRESVLDILAEAYPEAEETLIKDMSPDSPMDLTHIAGKKRSDTGGIARLFPEEMRQIGGEYARHSLNQRFPKCALDHVDVFQLLVAVVLSAQTTDVSVNKVSPELFTRWPDAAALAGANQDDVASVIRTIGMYRTKSSNIIRLARMLLEEYGGDVPQDREKLMALPGVGRKTANVVLAVGFGEQRIAVDTHVFRVANRIGLCKAPDVLKTELALMENLPECRWSEAHHSLIWHGRRVCHARKPDCEGCPVDALCLYVRNRSLRNGSQ